MNSYPPELLAQLAPVMFVAGLDAPPAPSQPPPPSTTDPDTPPPPPSKPQDAFQVLTLRLREVLLSQRKVALWQPEKNKTFQVILVDRDVRFPPRKLVPPEDPAYSSAHSPLSPLTPSSPLHPDGLIAPIWVRKHTTLLPAVLVLFMRIYESPIYATKSPLDVPDTDRERDREADERKRDSDLAADIAAKKKMTNERGIKLTVVLMASRRMLDDPALDARLSHIRRQSGLDSRAALFVLSPVSPAELIEFVRSLQSALYDPAIEYYTSHSKRVRRKRNRHSQAVSTYPAISSALAGVNIAKPLRPEGWTVRYEYKMACFAEFRSEDDVALKHYQDAYEMLTIMFGSTAILPPRTKRWAEAKVLADCINIKIVKLYLYNNEFALALAHHNSHIRQFGDFSRGWGIGEETFEFWSWIARQHRVLAELLEMGSAKSNLVIPVHKPTNPSHSQQTIRPQGAEYDALRTLGINPNHALQHPGFYYYMAARCTESRKERFVAALEAESQGKLMGISPGFTNEKKVDHVAVINELYGKAYDAFKKYNPSTASSQGRLMLWVAYRIAKNYFDAGKFDTAVRFFERIAKTYRREDWSSLLRPLISTWYECAKQLGDVELSIRLLVEMLGHELPEGEDPSSIEEDLIAVMKSSVPTSTEKPLMIDLSDAHSPLDTSAIFWSPEVKVGQPAAFQISLAGPRRATISSLPFSQLSILFKGNDAPLVIRHQKDEESKSHHVRRLDVGHITYGEEGTEITGDLSWGLGQMTIITGQVSAETPCILEVASLTLRIEENGWTIDLPLEPSKSSLGPRWLASIDPPKFIPAARSGHNSTIVQNNDHHLEIAFQHSEPAYLDEDYPIIVKVSNADERDLHVTISILLQPTEIDDAASWLVVDGERSSSLVKDVELGKIAPGEDATKEIHLFCTGAPGERVMDVSVRSRAVIEEGEDEEYSEEDGDGKEKNEADTMEHLKLLTVQAIAPLRVETRISYTRSREPWSGLADLRTFDAGFWDLGRGGVAHVVSEIGCVGPWGLHIEKLELHRRDNPFAKVLDSSADAEGHTIVGMDLTAGDKISSQCRIALRPMAAEDFSSTDAISGPGKYEITWRRISGKGQKGALSKTFITLPPLEPPKEELVALLDAPVQARLHQPVLVTLTVRNYHPTRSANIVVQLETEGLDGFVACGVRNGRLPILLPNAEETLRWRMIPIECGYVKLPRIKVLDLRKAIPVEGGAAAEAGNGELVPIVDLRRASEHQDGVGSILVLSSER